MTKNDYLIFWMLPFSNRQILLSFLRPSYGSCSIIRLERWSWIFSTFGFAEFASISCLGLFLWPLGIQLLFVGWLVMGPCLGCLSSKYFLVDYVLRLIAVWLTILSMDFFVSFVFPILFTFPIFAVLSFYLIHRGYSRPYPAHSYILKTNY